MIRRPVLSDYRAAASADVTADTVQPAGGCLGRRHLPQAVERRQFKSMFSLPPPSDSPYSQFIGVDAFDDDGDGE